MRKLSLLVLLASGLSAAPVELKSIFSGRSGAALLFDLKENTLISTWNDRRAKTTVLQPGSVLKPFTLAAYIEAGLYKKSLKAPEALAYSSNEYFEKLAARMEPADLERGYARFGLNYRAPTLTLAALLEATKRLVARHHEERLRPVFEGLEEAVSYGTARLAGIPLTRVAGKTGTTSSSALFFGYAPADKPRYLLLIHLDSGSGGGDAAPFAAKIFAKLFKTASSEFDSQSISVRLFWQNPPASLNLKPGKYPAGTRIEANTSQLNAPGPLTVELKNNAYLLTTQVPLENYVSAVLHGEAGGFVHQESRKAMAIAARTYAVRFRSRHSEEGFDFCDTTHCQDARFLLNERKELRDAVEATSAELLWHQGKPAATYYHADSGGWLEAASDAPYLSQRKDNWWQDSPESRWTWTVKLTELAQALNLTLITRNFRVSSREVSGRARGLDVFGHPAEAAAFRMLVGRTLGWDKMPSRMFEVTRSGQQLVFLGKGKGHGIGLPQSSAERMAASGKTHSEILSEYFPGTKIGITASGLSWSSVRSTRISLFTTNAAKDKALLALAEKELLVLEGLTRLKVDPSIRIYPSREAFRDVTGILDPVHGATRGRQIQLPPNPAIATLRHEMLHAILESNTNATHPDWFREGLVQALLNEKSVAGTRVAALIQRDGKAKILAVWAGSESMPW